MSVALLCKFALMQEKFIMYLPMPPLCVHSLVAASVGKAGVELSPSRPCRHNTNPHLHISTRHTVITCLTLLVNKLFSTPHPRVLVLIAATRKTVCPQKSVQTAPESCRLVARTPSAAAM